MKKMIFMAALLVSVYACKNETTNDNLPMPSTFPELFDGLLQQGGHLHVDIYSDDSVRTDYLYDWFDLYQDKRTYYVDMDTTLIDGTHLNDSIADMVAEMRAVEDSVARTEMMIRDYAQKGVQHLEEKYIHQSAKYYKFESHLNGKDSIEFVIATKELTDSLPEDCKKDDFRESFRYYPEFLHYFYTHKTNGDNYVSLTYHREERVKGKKATNEEEIRKLLLDYIAKQKGTKEYHVQYLIDEGKDFDQSAITFHSRKNKEKVHVEGTLYVLPGTGKEKIRNVEELRSMLKEFTTTHYAGYLNYHYVDKTFDMTECDRYTSQLMELTIGDERPWDSVANLFHVQIGNYWKGEGLKILMLKPINSSYFMPRLEWMEIKSIHNNEIEWLPGYEGGYLNTRE